MPDIVNTIRIDPSQIPADKARAVSEMERLKAELERETIKLKVELDTPSVRKQAATARDLIERYAISTPGDGSLSGRQTSITSRTADEQRARDAMAQNIRMTRQLATEAGMAAEANRTLYRRIGQGADDAASRVKKLKEETAAAGGTVDSQLRKFIALEAAGRTLASAARIGTALTGLSRARAAGDLEGEVQQAERLKQAVHSLPFLGAPAVAIAEIIDEWRGKADTLPGGRAGQQQWNENAQRRQDRRNDLTRAANDQILKSFLEQQGSGQSTERQRVQSLQEELRQFNKASALDPGTDPDKIEKGRTAILSRIRDAQIEEERAEDRATRERVNNVADAEQDARIARIQAIGQTELAARMRVLADIARAERAMQDKIDDAKRSDAANTEPGKRLIDNLTLQQQGLQRANKQALGAFDEGQRREARARVLQQIREDAQAAADSESRVRAANLHAAGRDYEAQTEVFEREWQRRIEIAERSPNPDAAGQARRERDAERSARQAERSRETQNIEREAGRIVDRARGRGALADVDEVKQQNEDDIRAAGADPARLSAAYSRARARLVALRESLKPHPTASITSMRDLYGGLLTSVFEDTDKARRERESRQRAGEDVGQAIRDLDKNRGKALDDAAKEQKEAAQRLKDAADKLLGAATIGIVRF